MMEEFNLIKLEGIFLLNPSYSSQRFYQIIQSQEQMEIHI